MRVTLNISALGQTRWYEYLSRLLFGGSATVIAGVIAEKYGPGLGGLFLAFPAIFPAGATLIESHEKRKGTPKGAGAQRGRRKAALDAAGASAGSFGLMIFGLAICKLIVILPMWATLTLATLAWLAVSVSAWRIWKSGSARI